MWITSADRTLETKCAVSGFLYIFRKNNPRYPHCPQRTGMVQTQCGSAFLSSFFPFAQSFLLCIIQVVLKRIKEKNMKKVGEEIT
jgi:hypothetical protein